MIKRLMLLLIRLSKGDFTPFSAAMPFLSDLFSLCLYRY